MKSLLLMLLLFSISARAKNETLNLSPFGEIKLSRSAAKPTGLVIVLAENDAEVAQLTSQVSETLPDYWVASLKSPAYIRHTAAAKSKCFYVAGDLENLSKYIEKKFGFKQYLQPIVIGQDSGAALAYLAEAQAPQNTFSGAIGLNFRLSIETPKPSCRVGDVKFERKDTRLLIKPPLREIKQWSAISKTTDLKSSLNFLANKKEVFQKQSDSPDLTDLPLVEVFPDKITAPYFIVFISGDGGWAGIDDSTSHELVAQGVPVVGINSLKYFWEAKTPTILAADIARIVSSYSKKLKLNNFKLVGYSFGADALPFAYNRMSAGMKKKNLGLYLLSVAKTASFEFHFDNWLYDSDTDLNTLDEFKKMAPFKPVCIYGADESDSLCPTAGPYAQVIKVSGGHHFDGDFKGLSDIITKK